jgi:hypothetical protein
VTPFQVLIGEVTKDREIDVILGKALGVLGHSELFEPISDLLHRGSAPELSGVARPHRQVYPANRRRNRRMRHSTFLEAQ